MSTAGTYDMHTHIATFAVTHTSVDRAMYVC